MSAPYYYYIPVPCPRSFCTRARLSFLVYSVYFSMRDTRAPGPFEPRPTPRAIPHGKYKREKFRGVRVKYTRPFTWRVRTLVNRCWDKNYSHREILQWSPNPDRGLFSCSTPNHQSCVVRNYKTNSDSWPVIMSVLSKCRDFSCFIYNK